MIIKITKLQRGTAKGLFAHYALNIGSIHEMMFMFPGYWQLRWIIFWKFKRFIPNYSLHVGSTCATLPSVTCNFKPQRDAEKQQQQPTPI